MARNKARENHSSSGIFDEFRKVGHGAMEKVSKDVKM